MEGTMDPQEEREGNREEKLPPSPRDGGDGMDEEAPEAAGGSWPVERLKPVLEAMIFAVADPLPTKKVCDAIDGVTAGEVKAAAAALQADYADRGIRLAEVAGGWQFRTAPEHHTPVRLLFKEKPLRLTRASLETLAIIAYKQPVTRAEVEAVRGVDCAAVLESLVERRVVRIAGRRDVPGRPLVYTTTPLFLEVFGLKDMKSLPTLAELGDDIGALAERSEFAEVGDPHAALVPIEDEEFRVDEAGEVPKVRFQSSKEAEAGAAVEEEAGEPARHED
jgi:segregation and condensation protein B